MELREALDQISGIRQQMAQSEVFRGYRSLTVAISACLALIASLFQTHVVAVPMEHLGRYLSLWIGVALVSAAIAGTELFVRARRAGPGLARDMTRLAVEQFIPCLVIGALLTLCVYRSAPQVAWMLPGLWSLLFSLGIFASCRLLPAQVVWAAIYYTVCGFICIRSGHSGQQLAAWQMGLCFGGGQLLCAGILFWTLERKHGTQEK